MTRLEEEIAEVIENSEYADDSTEVKANLIAEVAKRYIEKALHDSYCNGAADGSMAAKKQDYNNIGSNSPSQKWLKQNGVI